MPPRQLWVWGKVAGGFGLPHLALIHRTQPAARRWEAISIDDERTLAGHATRPRCGDAFVGLFVLGVRASRSLCAPKRSAIPSGVWLLPPSMTPDSRAPALGHIPILLPMCLLGSDPYVCLCTVLLLLFFVVWS